MAQSSALCMELATATATLLAPRTKSTSGRLRLGEIQPTERWSNEYHKTLLQVSRSRTYSRLDWVGEISAQCSQLVADAPVCVCVSWQYGVPQNSGHIYFLAPKPTPVDANADAADSQEDLAVLASCSSDEGSDSLLFAELLGLADPAEGAAEGDLVASIGRGSDLDACGSLGLALAESVETWAGVQASCVRVGMTSVRSCSVTSEVVLVGRHWAVWEDPCRVSF